MTRSSKVSPSSPEVDPPGYGATADAAPMTNANRDQSEKPEVNNKPEINGKPEANGKPDANGKQEVISKTEINGKPDANGKADPNPEAAIEAPACASVAFAQLLACIGGGGSWQWRLFWVTSFCGSFTSWHNLGAVFLAAEPDHWCQVADLPYNASETDMRGAIPMEEDQDGRQRYSRCLYYDRNYSALPRPLPPAPPGTPTLPCDAWYFNTSIYTSTVVSEFELVCGDRWLMSSVQSTYMLGFMVGALVLSELADQFGRRTLLLASTLGFIVTTIATTFSVNYLMFIIFRFFVAAFGSGIFLSNFVILMEAVDIHHRTLFGVLYHGFFSFGMCTLAALAYFFRDWRTLQLWCSVPTVLLLLYYFLVPESPRWLLTVGREDESLVILKQVAHTNGTELPPPDQLERCLKLFRKEKQQKDEQEKKNLLQSFLEFFENACVLVKTPNMRRRNLIIFFAWFVTSMIYYGLAFNGTNLKFPLYIMMVISGVVEVLSLPFNIWLLERWGRRLGLVFIMMVAGVACLVIIAVPRDLFWWNLLLASIGRFMVAQCFAVVFIYSSELVPTHVRNISMGTASMCARIGSFLAPYIVDQLGALHYAIPSSVFGAVAVASGLLALLLPETGYSNLPESVEEIEAMPR